MSKRVNNRAGGGRNVSKGGAYINKRKLTRIIKRLQGGYDLPQRDVDTITNLTWRLREKLWLTLRKNIYYEGTINDPRQLY